MSLKLYSPKSILVAGAKVQVLAKFLEIELQYERIPGAEWKSAEYLKKNPFGKVPTLQTPEGCIFQSLTIMRYLARKCGKMYGNNLVETANIDQWLEFLNTQLMPNLSRIFYAVFGYRLTTEEQYNAAKKQIIQTLKIIDSYLKNNKFLGSKDLSIADIAIATQLRYPFRLILDEKVRQIIPNVTKWMEELSSLEQFKSFFGKLWLCQKEFVPDFNFWQDEKKEEKKAKKAKQSKQQPKKKQQSKKSKKKKEDDQEEEEEKQVAEKKKINPLDLLPKSTFNIDDFKRDFCNAEDKIASLQKLWSNFDYEGWSIWKTHYIKYQGEGVAGYLTNNLKNGYLRNLDHFRKYTFAVLGVYGVEGNYQIEGAWLWRGTQIPQQWKQHQSFEYFIFKKLDPKNEVDRKLVQSYWLNLEEGQQVQGLPIYEAKWFK